MSIAYIRSVYKMPKLKRGLSCTYNGVEGKIISFANYRINIRLITGGRKLIIHPQDENLEIKYS